MIKIVIPGKPLPWKAPYVKGRRGAFSPRSEVMKVYRHYVREQYRGEPIDYAVNCDLFFFMPIPIGTSKANRMLMLEGNIRPSKRPDRTNMGKLYEDALNGIAIVDDGLIVDGRVAKWYCENPRVEIVITDIKSGL